MNKKYFLLTVVTLLLLTLTSCADDPVLILKGSTMGTWYTVKVVGVKHIEDEDTIRTVVERSLQRVNNCLNTYDPTSEISKVNALGDHMILPVSEQFRRVTDVAKSIYETSGGAFDPTVKPLVGLWGFGDGGINKRPTDKDIELALQHVGMNKVSLNSEGIEKQDPEVHLDYSAIAKGYGVDVVTNALAGLGWKDILVEIGGEVRVKGKVWHIGIAVPDDNNPGNQRSAEIIGLKDLACATSGDYQQFYEVNGKRYTHLIDPKTGYPIRHELTSVTVIAENCMLADAAATAAIVLGKTDGMAFIEKLEGVEAFFIYRDGDVLKPLQSSGWVW